MKKLFCFILSVLLLCSSAVCAHAAPALILSDPVVSWDDYSETAHIDLTGFVAKLGLLSGENGFALNLLGDGRLLLAAEALLSEEGALLYMNGLSHAYSVSFGSLAGEAGVDSPMPDFEALREILVRGVQIRSTEDGMRFRIPHTTVYELMDELRPFMAETLDPLDYDELYTLFDDRIREDSGFAIEGQWKTTGRGAEGQFSVLAVVNGRYALDPLFSLSLSLTADGGGAVLLSGEMRADVNGSGTSRTLGTLYASVRPDADGGTLLRLDVLADEDADGGLNPLCVVEGTVTPAEGGRVWHFMYSDRSYGDAEPVPVAAFDGSFLRGEDKTELHLELADAYLENVPVPYYGLDLTETAGDGESSWEFVWYTHSNRTDGLEPQFALSVRRTEQPDGADASLLLSYADYSGSGISPKIRAELSRRSTAEGSELHARLYSDELSYADPGPFATLDVISGATFLLDLQIPAAGSFRLEYEPSSGALKAACSYGGFSADLEMTAAVGDAELVRCEKPVGEPVDVPSMDDGQIALLQRELRSATAYLVGYLYPAYIQATGG